MRARRIVLPLIVLGVAGYFALFGGEYDFFDVRRLQRERDEEAVKIRLLRDSLALLRARVDSLQNDTLTLERIARERFGMIKPGERLYRFAPDSGSRADTAPARPR